MRLDFSNQFHRCGRIVLSLVLGLISVLGLPAQGYIFDSLGRGDGLLSLSVSALTQDKRGFIWVGTQGGLHRYNGDSFDVHDYRSFDPTSISSNSIQTLFYEPESDILWVGTYQGLNKAELPAVEFSRFQHDPELPNSLSDNVVVTIHRDRKGRLWVGTLGGLNRMLPEEQGFHRYPVSPEEGNISDPTIRDVLEDSSGRIWIVSNGGVYLYREESDDFELLIGSKMGNSVNDLGMVASEARDGSLYFGFWDGDIIHYDPNSRQVLKSFTLSDRRIYSMMFDQFDQLWLGTWGGGLFIYDSLSQELTNVRSQRGVHGSLSGDIVYSFLEDRTGIVWLGTHGNGLDRYNPLSRTFSQLAHVPDDPQSLSAGSVTRIFRDRDERYWVGTYNGGLNLLSHYGTPIKHYRHNPEDPASISNDIIRDIAQLEDGSIWIATNYSLNRFMEDGTFQHYDVDDEVNPLRDYIVMAILPHEDPDLIWIGSYSNGVYAWGPERGIVDEIPFSSKLIYELIRDSRDRIWIGSNHGLAVYDGQNLREIFHNGTKEGLAGETVRAILEDRDSRFWAGTLEGGITVFDSSMRIIRHFTKEDGLLSNTILSLVMDKAGYIWAATNRGINQISLRTGVLRSMSREQGLASDEFSSGVFIDEEGYLTFGNAGGLVRFHPEQVSAGQLFLPPIITEVMLGQRLITLDGNSTDIEEVNVPWTENSLSLEFGTMNYAALDDERFVYRLRGFMEAWQSSGKNHQVSFTNLPPGRYLFQVALREPEPGVELPAASQVSIVVEAPPERRWWAYLLYLAAAILLVYGVTQIRVSRALSSQVKTLEAVKHDLEAANRKLNYLSYHDVLSSLGNRRLFVDTLHREWTRSRRTREPITLISLDIDFFKRYNDSLGHPAGDLVLKEVAEILRLSVNRPSDLACRMGGEEFSLILPSTPLDGGLKVAEEIMRRMEEKAIPHPDSSIGKYLTLSIGVASITPEEPDYQHLVQLCDQALYQAKRDGRKRIVVADSA